jgi:hypothetical protein
MSERRWFIVCAAVGALTAVALFWATGPTVVAWLGKTPAGHWITPAQTPRPAATIGN